MKKRFLAILSAAFVALAFVCGCDRAPLDFPHTKDGDPTNESYFEFTVTDDGLAYIIAAKADVTLPSRLIIPETYNEKDAKSLGNEINDEISGIFKARKQVNLDKVKMPKAVSRTKAKNGIISYDCDSLANRFGTLYPEYKDEIKKNIVAYGEFLPETFFTEVGTAKVLDVIKNGNTAEQKKLFKMLNEVYEDGTNEVQDVIGVTILGAMQNDKDMMAVADKYMSEYMSGPVHEINKLTAKNNSKLMKKLKNPPAYKPKKKKNNFMQNALQAQDMNR